MLEIVDVQEPLTLDDYDGVAHLSPAVRALRAEAKSLAPKLAGRTVWMVNSTARGGGVAEMLPRVISMLRELGVDVRWAVIGTDEARFFDFTKRMHNLIHGAGTPEISSEDREVFEQVNQANAGELHEHLAPGDVLVVHDPQPIALARELAQKTPLPTIWRCHIGLPERTPQTAAAWNFLRPYCEHYDLAYFSAPEYIPAFLAGRSKLLYPAIDPLSHKNRELHPHKLMGVLCNSGMVHSHGPVVTADFAHLAKRLNADGQWLPPNSNGDLELMYRPVVTQISRWDRLKGFGPLLEAFAALKTKGTSSEDPRHRRRVEIVRLVLAGPDPASIQDDPEGLGVIEELSQAYRALPASVQKDVALVSLPMDSREENALMVNALQRCSTVVVQNSIQEGFGLTATEGMWKRVPVLVSSAAGLRQQVREGVDGRILPDATDTENIREVLDAMLEDDVGRRVMGRSAQRRVHDNFLVFNQVSSWLNALVEAVERRPQRA